MNYPSELSARRDIVEAGRRMYGRGFVSSNDGNLSARVAENMVIATPSGVSKGFMTEDMLVALDLDGNVLYSSGKPSSEIKMHLAVYSASPELRAVVHAHPPVATALAAGGIPLDTAILQEAVMLLGVIPVAPYAPPGSEELARGAAQLCTDYNGTLLEHHGAVTWGADVMGAFFRLENIEYVATVTMYMKMMGITRTLSERQIDELIAMRPMWGITAGGRPKSLQEGQK